MAWFCVKTAIKKPRYIYFQVGEPESVSTTDIASILIFQNFDKKQVCSRTPIRPLQNLCFIVQKCKLSHFDDIFSDDLGHWVKSKAKLIKCEHLGDQVMPIVHRNDEKVEKCYNIKRHIFYHRKSNDFRKVILTVENVDYIFLQYYFDENVHEVDINAPHGNAKRLKKPHRRTKESVKDAVKKSGEVARKVVQDIFLQHGGFQNVQSPSNFPKNRKQVSNLRYFGDPSNTRDRDDIVEILDMCQNEVANNKYIRNVLMAPEKIISLMTLISLMNYFYVTIATYMHLLFSTENCVPPVMLGPTLIHTKKEHSSYFQLPSEMLRLEPKVKDIIVFGSDAEKKCIPTIRGHVPFCPRFTLRLAYEGKYSG